MLHYRVCKFETATEHLLLALRLAKAEESKINEFAALSNIACLLNAVGLVREAIDLSRTLCTFPKSGTRYLQFHFQTCVNAVQFGYAASMTSKSLEIFYDSLTNVLALGYQPTNLEKAYTISARVMYQLCDSECMPLIPEIERALEAFDSTLSPRAAAVLLFTRARIALKFDILAEISRSTNLLLELLPKVRGFPEYFEESLEMLLTLYDRHGDNIDSSESSLEVASLLREHLLGVKRQSFIAVFRRTRSSTKPGIARAADGSQDIPAWLSLLKDEMEEYVGYVEPKSASSIDDLHRQRGLLELARLVNERSSLAFDRGLRSEAYDIAENWAIASELRAQGNGRALFAVGEIAYLIAKSMGRREREAVRIGMASRLRDIGQIVVGSEHSPKFGDLADANFLGRLHVEYAAEVLSMCGEVELRKYVGTIRHHHEWWNGSGYPDGLRGEFIPLGARVCAYADVFVSHVWKSPGRFDVWTHDEAIRQIQSMGGMQLDSGLFQPFISAIEVYSKRWGNVERFK